MKFVALALIALAGTTEAIRVTPNWTGYDPDHAERQAIDGKDAQDIADYQHIGNEKVRTVWHYDEGHQHRCTYYSCK